MPISNTHNLPADLKPGGARLRITLTAAHLTDDIDTLLEALSDAQHQNA
ncbi:hypothetical protein JZM24_17175 [Candidatus Sodalis endolongispinus]|uniref:8-amino-7-oxononanoate synthase n=1 Tax=Candidatus Sodalis endolongispinus TaxID=2812662 RepID=A0ABS5YED3_9GAMM|nr:hypothetical protein [Candidatus Sodalis endolongispinus]MBT9433400.1 hypothetical protein [Candidatus Sodalis endolongispinus]